MYRQIKKLISLCKKNSVPSARRHFTIKSNIHVNEEVRFALENKKPIVALESTIITHGMPFPENIKCAIDVEEVIRMKGATPATVAIINGHIKLGLSMDELELLADIKKSKAIKTSRRDFPYVISNKLNGGTTVSGTLIVANMAGIPIFATGGIGGVHRGAQETFDISADLTELGRCGVAVVSSGVKSILDIPKTLQYLETQGVFVATCGDSVEFPAFYSRVSGSKAPYCVKTAIEAAKIIKSSRDLGINSGMLFAVPAPGEEAFPLETMNNIIEEALGSLKGKVNVTDMGKNVTPIVLSQIAKMTGGKALKTNIALVKNNAKTAAEIAIALADLEHTEKDSTEDKNTDNLIPVEGRPIVIGGSNLDCSVTLKTSEIKIVK